MRAFWKSLNSMLMLQVILPRKVIRLAAYSDDRRFLPCLFRRKISLHFGKDREEFFACLISKYSLLFLEEASC